MTHLLFLLYYVICQCWWFYALIDVAPRRCFTVFFAVSYAIFGWLFNVLCSNSPNQLPRLGKAADRGYWHKFHFQLLGEQIHLIFLSFLSVNKYLLSPNNIPEALLAAGSGEQEIRCISSFHSGCQSTNIDWAYSMPRPGQPLGFQRCEGVTSFYSLKLGKWHKPKQNGRCRLCSLSVLVCPGSDNKNTLDRWFVKERNFLFPGREAGESKQPADSMHGKGDSFGLCVYKAEKQEDKSTPSNLSYIGTNPNPAGESLLPLSPPPGPPLYNSIIMKIDFPHLNFKDTTFYPQHWRRGRAGTVVSSGRNTLQLQASLEGGLGADASHRGFPWDTGHTVCYKGKQHSQKGAELLSSWRMMPKFRRIWRWESSFAGGQIRNNRWMAFKVTPTFPAVVKKQYVLLEVSPCCQENQKGNLPTQLTCLHMRHKPHLCLLPNPSGCAKILWWWNH